MPESIRLWSVADETLRPLDRQPVDLESRLEDWMHSDIGVLSDDLLVIGRQLDTQGGGTLDLLCIDRSGDLVLVELKRGRTPRDVVAQALDYAAWVVGLSYDDIRELARDAIGGELEAAFAARFETELPDVLNAEHRLVIVASEVDDRTERIIRYLNDVHGVAINAVTFNYFRDADGRELLARTHLIEPDVAEDRADRRPGSKRRRKVTMEDHRRDAEALELGDVFDALLSGLGDWLVAYPKVTMVTCEDRQEKVATLNVVPAQSSATEGLRVNIYRHRLARAVGIDTELVSTLLPGDAEPWSYAADSVDHTADWDGFTCSFPDLETVQRFLDGLRRVEGA